MARTAADLPVLLQEGLEVAFVPPQLDVPRRAIVEEVIGSEGSSFELSFVDLDHEQAEKLVGCHCLVKRSDIEEGLLEEDGRGIEGWTVIAKSGAVIGTIEEVIENPGQSLLRVARSHDEDALIPLVDEFITEIDEDACSITVDLPQGLLEL